MSQQVIQDSTCGNKKFYKCIVDESKRCINCKKSFIEKGDFVQAKCRECNKLTQIKIEGKYSDTSEPYGECQQCIDDEESTHDVYQRLVWACESDKTVADEIQEKALEEIVNLPKNQIKHILRSMNRGIER